MDVLLGYLENAADLAQGEALSPKLGHALAAGQVRLTATLFSLGRTLVYLCRSHPVASVFWFGFRCRNFAAKG
jgi:hypothetical protein